MPLKPYGMYVFVCVLEDNSSPTNTSIRLLHGRSFVLEEPKINNSSQEQNLIRGQKVPI
jgi:hypothetical protein